MKELKDKLDVNKRERDDIQNSINELDQKRNSLTTEIDVLSRQHDEVRSKRSPVLTV